jgi:photosystem II stability/assembly factor-like uncharacterized protein
MFFGLAVIAGAGVFVAEGRDGVLRSRDFGRTWADVKLPPSAANEFFVAVAFADAKRGFACGTHGTIISTTDGGDTWKQELSGQTGVLRDIAFLGDEVYIGGDGRSVIKRRLEPAGPKQGAKKIPQPLDHPSADEKKAAR